MPKALFYKLYEDNILEYKVTVLHECPLLWGSAFVGVASETT